MRHFYDDRLWSLVLAIVIIFVQRAKSYQNHMKRLTSFKPLWFFLLLTLVGAIAAANHTTKRGFVAVEGNDKIPTSQNHTAEQEHIALIEPKVSNYSTTYSSS
jgi:hypothetical protein